MPQVSAVTRSIDHRLVDKLVERAWADSALPGRTEWDHKRFVEVAGDYVRCYYGRYRHYPEGPQDMLGTGQCVVRFLQGGDPV